MSDVASCRMFFKDQIQRLKSEIQVECTCHPFFAESHREDSPVVGPCTSGAPIGLIIG